MLKKEQAQPEKKYLSISLNRIFWSMKIRSSARRVLSRISFDAMGIRWEELDEDISIESFEYDDPEPRDVARL